jgi:hypothetical protein
MTCFRLTRPGASDVDDAWPKRTLVPAACCRAPLS